MTYAGKQVAAQLFRRGRTATVKIKASTSQNAFGNIETQYTVDRTVIAFRTYPNRNTQIESKSGDLSQDRAVFLVPIGPDQPKPPETGNRLVYDGDEYEVKSPTPYDTHIEFFGSPIIHES